MSALSAKHFTQFKRYTRKWLKAFGLLAWSVNVKLEELESQARLSECAVDPNGRFAELGLNTVWVDTPVTANELSRIACHEVLHILLARMTHLATERFVTERELEDAEHDVIRAVLQFIFPEKT